MVTYKNCLLTEIIIITFLQKPVLILMQCSKCIKEDHQIQVIYYNVIVLRIYCLLLLKPIEFICSEVNPNFLLNLNVGFNIRR